MILLTLVLLLATTIQSKNVETRVFQVIKPNKPNGLNHAVFNYGASVAVKAGTPTTLYVGAPSYEAIATNNSWKPGTVFSCSIDGRAQGITSCSNKFNFQDNGAMGITVDLEPSATKLVACGHLYHHTCSKGSELLVGSCYTQNLVRNITQQLRTPCPALCSGALIVDMVFAIDESSSVSEADFRLSLTWLTNLTYGFKDDIDNGDVRVGVYTFSEQPTARILLQKRSFAELQASISSITQNFGGTDIRKALLGVAGEFTFRGRPNVPYQMVILTDGFTNSDDVTNTATFLRSTHTIVSVGVGLSDKSQLLAIAGNESRVFAVGNFTNLFNVVDGLRLVIKAAATTLEGSGNNGTDFLSRCQIGFSTTVSKTSDLYVGAVGSYDSAGTVVDYRDNDESIKSSFSRYIGTEGVTAIFGASSIQSLNQSYLGYSVTTGFFLSGTEFIASGSPRYHSKGIVAIYPAFGAIDSSTTHHSLHPSGPMWQLGAYFGQSVLAVDVNNDNFDDLLVSAPLYSNQGRYDQGRVFVYMNNPDKPGPQYWSASAFYSPQVLKGSDAVGSRFGMSIINAGDLDQNGYDDIVIGAPGEDAATGSIHIYYLSKLGVSPSMTQVVKGKSISSNLKLFGFTASKTGKDVDGNGFPDLVVSAPSSDRVVVLRSRSILDVTSRIILNPPNLDLIGCLKNSLSSCGSVTTCISGTLRRMTAGETYEMNTDLVLDATSAVKRLIFFNSTQLSMAKNLSIGLQESCETHLIQVQPSSLTTSLISTAIVIQFSHHLPSRHLNTQMSPVLDHFASNFTEVVWPSRAGCYGNGGFCDYDLTIDATYSIRTGKEPFVIGTDPPIFTVNVAIGNNGSGDSYFTKIEMTSPQLSFVQANGSCVRTISITSPGLVVLEYVSPALSNRFMAPGTKCHFTLYYSFNSLLSSASTEQFDLTGRILSSLGNTSNERDTTNNMFHYSKDLLYATDVLIGGTGTPASIFVLPNVTSQTVSSLNDAALGESRTDLHHTYKIVNNGPNVVSRAAISFQWPALTKQGQPLFYLYEFKCEPKSKCICSSLSDVDKLQLRYSNNSVSLNYNSTSTFNPKTTCQDVQCLSINCSTNQLSPHTTLSVTSSFKVWLPTFQQKNFETTLTSHLAFDTTGSPLVITNPIQRSSINTKVTDKVTSAATDDGTINIIVIIAGVLGGILLLVALVIALWKGGFFKSKYADMKREAENENSPEGGEQTTDNDVTEAVNEPTTSASTMNLVDD